MKNPTILAFAVCHTLDHGQANQRAGAAISMIDETNNRLDITQNLGFCTANLGELQTVLLALASVRPSYRTKPLKIITNGHYVSRVLAKKNGKYTMNPAKYADKIQQLRNLVEQHHHVLIEFVKNFDSGDKILAPILSTARASANREQPNSVTGPYEYNLRKAIAEARWDRYSEWSFNRADIGAAVPS